MSHMSFLMRATPQVTPIHETLVFNRIVVPTPTVGTVMMRINAMRFFRSRLKMIRSIVEASVTHK